MDEGSGVTVPPNATPEDLQDSGEMYRLAAGVRRAHADMLNGQWEIARILASMIERNGCKSLRELIETEHLSATAADEILQAHEVPVDPDTEAQF